MIVPKIYREISAAISDWSFEWLVAVNEFRNVNPKQERSIDRAKPSAAHLISPILIRPENENR